MISKGKTKSNGQKLAVNFKTNGWMWRFTSKTLFSSHRVPLWMHGICPYYSQTHLILLQASLESLQSPLLTHNHVKLMTPFSRFVIRSLPVNPIKDFKCWRILFHRLYIKCTVCKMSPPYVSRLLIAVSYVFLLWKIHDRLDHSFMLSAYFY